MNVRTAIISVSDKKGIVDFTRELTKLNIDIISTGGTHKELLKNGVKSISVSEYTSSPEILDGRVKTLHPQIEGGILADKKNKKHIEELKNLKIKPIDLVVVNLYPFEEIIHKKVLRKVK